MTEAIKSDELYLQVHGLAVRPEGLNKQLVRVIDQMRETLYVNPHLSSPMQKCKPLKPADLP